MKCAKYWAKEGGLIRCGLCPHECLVAEGSAGFCGVRGSREGEMFSLSYGLISSAHIDPVEKKPLYHYLPGSNVFSIGSWGCNMRCRFCQNWSISQGVVGCGRSKAPERVVEDALAAGCSGIAYTYNEPVIWFEYISDCARLARNAGLRNILITNGFVLPDPARELLGLIDAVNLDIKSMDDLFYVKYCSARLGPVLDFAKLTIELGVHLEVTNLVIPTLNDSAAGFEELGRWVSREIGDRVPVHLSAYRPDYEMDLPATRPAALEAAYGIVSRHLKYVYLGNVRTEVGRDTCCPKCGHVLIDRRQYIGRFVGLSGHKCRGCSSSVDVVLG